MSFRRWLSLFLLICLPFPTLARVDCAGRLSRVDTLDRGDLRIGLEDISWKKIRVSHKSAPDFQRDRRLLLSLASRSGFVVPPTWLIDELKENQIHLPDEFGTEDLAAVINHLQNLFLESDPEFKGIHAASMRGFVWTDAHAESAEVGRVGHFWVTDQRVFWKDKFVPGLALSVDDTLNLKPKLFRFLFAHPHRLLRLPEIADHLFPESSIASKDDQGALIAALIRQMIGDIKAVDPSFDYIQTFAERRRIWVHLGQRLKEPPKAPRATPKTFRYRDIVFTLPGKPSRFLSTLIAFNRATVSAKTLTYALTGDLKEMSPSYIAVHLFYLRRALRLIDPRLDAIDVEKEGCRWAGDLIPELVE